MVLMQRVVKPKTQRAKRALQAREPKAVENTKNTLFIKGSTCSARVSQVLKDLYALKRPYGELYLKRPGADENRGQKGANKGFDIRPFEDATQLERFGKKKDASLFAFGSHNKKRPDNLVLGRLYDEHLLDMIELGVSKFKSLREFKNEKISAGVKPCLLFSGEAFEKSDEMKRLKSLLIDFFRGPEVKNIRLAGLEHALQFTAVDDAEGGTDKIYMRSYKLLLKKSSNPKLPRVEVEEIGPSIDFVIRRSHLASDDLFKTACKQVKNVYKAKKTKNIEEDAFGSTLGRVHVPSQDVSKIQTRKMKGLKETKKAELEKKKEGEEAARKARVEAVFNEPEESDQMDVDD